MQRELFGNGGKRTTSTVLSSDGRDLLEGMARMTVEYLKEAYESFTGEKPPPSSKMDLVRRFAALLDFRDRAASEQFLGSLPGHTRTAIERGTFHPFVDADLLTREHGVSIILTEVKYGYRRSYTLSPDSRLRMFILVDDTTIRLPDPLRAVFSRWLPKPPGWDPLPASPPEDAALRLEGRIEEVLPLARNELRELERFDTIYAGFTRTESRKLQERCGIAPFPIAERYGVFAGELLLRFLACFDVQDRTGEGDAAAHLKELVGRFFNGTKSDRDYLETTGLLFEHRCLLPHLSKPQGVWGHDAPAVPASRATVLNALGRARSGEWYGVDELLAAAELRIEPLSPFEDERLGYDLRLKGAEIRVGNRRLVAEAWDDYFTPAGVLHRELVSVPLFRAYLYLFASLGLLETAEREPPKRLIKKAKELPLTPFDGLAAIRITPLGAWCFGHLSERPERKTANALVLADGELPILTIRGEALEKRLYLDRIGVRLGPERYRVTEASFVAGCNSPQEIEERIERFHALVSANPPELWTAMFAAIRRKSTIFGQGKPAIIFDLPNDERIRSLFFTNPALRSIAIKAEGGRIVCRAEDYPRLAKALKAEGFYCPPRAREGVAEATAGRRVRGGRSEGETSPA